MRTIKTDESKTYHNAEEVLTDCGFRMIGQMYGPVNPVTSKTKCYGVVEEVKTGKHYAYMGMEHFNTTVFNVKLKKININKLSSH